MAGLIVALLAPLPTYSMMDTETCGMGLPGITGKHSTEQLLLLTSSLLALLTFYDLPDYWQQAATFIEQVKPSTLQPLILPLQESFMSRLERILVENPEMALDEAMALARLENSDEQDEPQRQKQNQSFIITTEEELNAQGQIQPNRIDIPDTVMQVPGVICFANGDDKKDDKDKSSDDKGSKDDQKEDKEEASGEASAKAQESNNDSNGAVACKPVRCFVRHMNQNGEPLDIDLPDEANVAFRIVAGTANTHPAVAYHNQHALPEEGATSALKIYDQSEESCETMYGQFARVYIVRVGAGSFALKQPWVYEEETDDPEQSAQNEQTAHEEIERELITLSLLIHESIIKLLAVTPLQFSENTLSWMLILENGGQDLLFMLHKSGKRNREIVLASALPISLQLVEVLLYIHQQGYLHGDIKSENILVRIVKGQLLIKLINFGSAHTIAEAEQEHYITGSPEYMAPELSEQLQGWINVLTETYSVGNVMGRLADCDSARGAEPVRYKGKNLHPYDFCALDSYNDLSRYIAFRFRAFQNPESISNSHHLPATPVKGIEHLSARQLIQWLAAMMTRRQPNHRTPLQQATAIIQQYQQTNPQSAQLLGRIEEVEERDDEEEQGE